MVVFNLPVGTRVLGHDDETWPRNKPSWDGMYATISPDDGSGYDSFASTYVTEDRGDKGTRLQVWMNYWFLPVAFPEACPECHSDYVAWEDYLCEGCRAL